MHTDIWTYCLERLDKDLPAQQFTAWIVPLRCVVDADEIEILAPNRYVLEIVEKNYLALIERFIKELDLQPVPSVTLKLGQTSSAPDELPVKTQPSVPAKQRNQIHGVNPDFTFDTFVEGKSNQFARAAGVQVGENPGKAYNPLYIYGGVGLGKTHLLHAVGNMIAKNNHGYQVAYMHSEAFVAEMVKALQHGTINEFKRRIRSVNALLIDDVQFFAKKERTQEEFFHTFNALLESRQQIILTSDRYPKEVEVEDRLRSRFGWGLTVEIDPPDFETRVAILCNKAQQLFGLDLEHEVADFVGKHVHSNVRELEGALRGIVAKAEFTGKKISLEFARESLRDLIAVNERLITIANIQQSVADYYGIKLSEMSSKKRSRTVARPRQVAMALAKELTMHSYPEIGEAFGGRDHTTVLYAVGKIKELREQDSRVAEDYQKLLRVLSV